MDYSLSGGTIVLRDRASRVGIYVVATSQGERMRIASRRQALVANENSHKLDPGRNAQDLAILQELLPAKGE